MSTKLIHTGTSLYEAINYITQMFYLSGRQYTSGASKIGMLLTIAAITAAKEGKKLFWEDVIKREGSGVTVSGVNAMTDLAVYLPYTCNDNEEPFTAEFSDEEYVPKRYRDVQYLSKEVKDLIEDVFRNFASYPPSALGKVINTIINQEGMVNETGVILLEQIQDLDMDKLKQENNQSRYDLIEYLQKERKKYEEAK